MPPVFWLAGLLLAGCHAAKRPAPPVPAYADLDVLVRRHPGWRSVAQYDGMLARLRAAIRQAQAAGGRPGDGPRPARPVRPGPAGGGVHDARRRPGRGAAPARRPGAGAGRPPAGAARDGPRGSSWTCSRRGGSGRPSCATFRRPRRPRRGTRSRYDAAFQAGDVRRLNLTLQINALEKTVAQWKLSKPPPTPLLDQASKDLADKQADLARLEAERAGTAGALAARARPGARPGRRRARRLRR